MPLLPPADLTFGAGSGMLGASIGLNTVSTHGACTAVFVAVTAIAVICLSSIRTLGHLSLLAWGGLISLLVAGKDLAQVKPSSRPIMASPLLTPPFQFAHVRRRTHLLTVIVTIVTIAVGVQERPDTAPQQGSWTSDYKLFGSPSFTEAISAITTFIFAYAGTPLFFPIVSEMRDPRLYAKALTICQIVVTITYVTVGIVVYYFCGSYVASPALGSAGKTVKQISYGIALPGLVVGATLSTHVSRFDSESGLCQVFYQCLTRI
jgi:hypothetical protein